MESGKLESGNMELAENVSGFISEAEDLEVFKKAYSLSLEIHRISLTLPKIEQYDLASQMRRASKSVCANIGEGFEKQVKYPAEFKRFIQMSIGSCGEMKIWLKYCLDLGYVDSKKVEDLKLEYKRLIKMLGSLSSKI